MLPRAPRSKPLSSFPLGVTCVLEFSPQGCGSFTTSFGTRRFDMFGRFAYVWDFGEFCQDLHRSAVFDLSNLVRGWGFCNAYKIQYRASWRFFVSEVLENFVKSSMNWPHSMSAILFEAFELSSFCQDLTYMCARKANNSVAITKLWFIHNKHQNTRILNNFRFFASEILDNLSRPQRNSCIWYEKICLRVLNCQALVRNDMSTRKLNNSLAHIRLCFVHHKHQNIKLARGPR